MIPHLLSRELARLQAAGGSASGALLLEALLIGMCEGEFLCASDTPALAGFTRTIPPLAAELLEGVVRIQILACGTSRHAALVDDHDRRCEQLAHLFADTQDVIFLGRGINYPIALEGALKLKEIS